MVLLKEKTLNYFWPNPRTPQENKKVTQIPRASLATRRSEDLTPYGTEIQGFRPVPHRNFREVLWI